MSGAASLVNAIFWALLQIVKDPLTRDIRREGHAAVILSISIVKGDEGKVSLF